MGLSAKPRPMLAIFESDIYLTSTGVAGAAATTGVGAAICTYPGHPGEHMPQPSAEPAMTLVVVPHQVLVQSTVVQLLNVPPWKLNGKTHGSAPAPVVATVMH
eukprot:gnl/TRDRNA2_/TRDRNA2_172559_c0_seq2.p2 gnl/TRDRNA2_/TRDRNA2_172559_c0~~gnl/TRDRNA2_/TRDRNA2_172559_c0_seq2.p2  ORF type:complete len:103 (-),score=11.58 gnl/TRDRNA2_/TRDRNA2_172559_c0_seq2:75-383(-)